MGLTYKVGRLITKTLAATCFSFRAYHAERIPRTGGLILAMNHQSYVDPPLAGLCCHREVYYLAKKELLDWPIIGPLFPRVHVIPVDQNRADMSAVKTVIKVLRGGEAAVIFPEGSRTPDGNFLPALPGLGLIIAKTLVPVVPMRIFGAFEAFPIGGKPRRHPVSITVGEPMLFTEADCVGPAREVYQRLSEEVMAKIATLQKETPDER